jgi:hypothetical protein
MRTNPTAIQIRACCIREACSGEEWQAAESLSVFDPIFVASWGNSSRVRLYIQPAMLAFGNCLCTQGWRFLFYVVAYCIACVCMAQYESPFVFYVWLYMSRS